MPKGSEAKKKSCLGGVTSKDFKKMGWEFAGYGVEMSGFAFKNIVRNYFI